MNIYSSTCLPLIIFSYVLSIVAYSTTGLNDIPGIRLSLMYFMANLKADSSILALPGANIPPEKCKRIINVRLWLVKIKPMYCKLS